jgi:hypothetical protein
MIRLRNTGDGQPAENGTAETFTICFLYTFIASTYIETSFSKILSYTGLTFFILRLRFFSVLADCTPPGIWNADPDLGSKSNADPMRIRIRNTAIKRTDNNPVIYRDFLTCFSTIICYT